MWPIDEAMLTSGLQYHVYLFETILLCCKDIDMNKPKNKNKRGKPKLQLKGRIFMQNVTDLIYSARPGMLHIGSFFEHALQCCRQVLFPPLQDKNMASASMSLW